MANERTSRMSEEREIEIRVDPNGNFHYSYALLHVRPGDRVRWVCKDGDFTVSFIDRTPFAHRFEFYGFKEDEMDFVELSQELQPGVYHYRVAVGRQVDDSGRRKIFIDGGCPAMEFP